MKTNTAYAKRLLLMATPSMVTIIMVAIIMVADISIGTAAAQEAPSTANEALAKVSATSRELQQGRSQARPNNNRELAQTLKLVSELQASLCSPSLFAVMDKVAQDPDQREAFLGSFDKGRDGMTVGKPKPGSWLCRNIPLLCTNIGRLESNGAQVELTWELPPTDLYALHGAEDVVEARSAKGKWKAWFKIKWKDVEISGGVEAGG